MAFKTIKFSNNKTNDIMGTLRIRVKEYFDSKNLARYGDSSMVWKTVFMISLYLIPYFLMLSGLVTNTWTIFGLWLLMGFGMAGIGFSIMHDANHGSYSKNEKVNKYLGYLINIIGGSSVNWKIQHNVLHHSYTNIDGFDEDISIGKMLRFSPHQPRLFIHRAQHIYAWFFYSFMTLNWIISKDFLQLFRYNEKDLIKAQKRTFKGLFIELIISKLFYIFFFVVIPVILLPIPWWQTLLFFFIMHAVASFIVAIIFQCAHIMPTSDYPLPDDDGNIENNFTLHQLLTTANFSPTNRLFSWFIGGLNFQIEHHLFPNICHIHYRNLSNIVRETAAEYGIPYNEHPNFYKAVKNHIIMLRDLGKYDDLPEYYSI